MVGSVWSLIGLRSSHNYEETPPEQVEQTQHFYWELVESKFQHLDSVKFLNFHDSNAEEEFSGKTKGQKWLLLMLSETSTAAAGSSLVDVLSDIMSNEAVMKLYSPIKSYFWKNSEKLLECAQQSFLIDTEDGTLKRYRQFLRDKYGGESSEEQPT